MADLVPLKIASEAGCKRDGTILQGENYVDTQWCRFQLRKGLPRKMGGYRRLTAELSGISRGLNVFNSDLDTYTHSLAGRMVWSGFCSIRTETCRLFLTELLRVLRLMQITFGSLILCIVRQT